MSKGKSVYHRRYWPPVVFALFMATMVYIITGTTIQAAAPDRTMLGGRRRLALPRREQLRPATPGSFLFGVINDIGGHFEDERARGIRATTLEFQWKLYEPVQGAFDAAYINQMKDRMAALKSQGWYVQLVPGYHYVPEWVFTLYPDMEYVNQYGEKYAPNPVSQGDFRVINAAFNPQARSLIAAYLQRVFTDFPQSDALYRFDSVRIGGGVQGEVRYPPSEWNGHNNAYWAFDTYAQNPGTSGIPAEVIGWRPGVDVNPGSQGRGQLLINPGFEDARPDYPLLAWTSDDGLQADLTTDNVFTGGQSLRLGVLGPERIHQFVRVDANTTYQVEAAFRSGDGNGRARLFLNQYDANFSLVANAPFLKLETQSSSWQLVSGSLQTASATKFLKVEMDGDAPGDYYFDDLALQRQGETDTRSREISVPIAFYEWYVNQLGGYQNWQISEVRKYFSGQLDITYAGKGVLPDAVMAALTNDLRGDGWSEASRGLYAGTAYHHLVPALGAAPNTAIYLTGIEADPPEQVDDFSPYPNDWSAARWLASLAAPHNYALWAENSGCDTLQELWLAAHRMRVNGYSGLMWAFEKQLYGLDGACSGAATISDYENLIRFYDLFWRNYLPGMLHQARSP